MRVCLFNWKDSAHPAAGGAEVYTREVLSRWSAAGHEVTWFAADVPGAESETVTPEGVRIVRRGSRLGVYSAARTWFQAQPRDRFDLVIDEINTRPFHCAAWAGGTPVVGFAHQVAREVWFSEVPWPAAAFGRWVLEPRWLRALRDVPVLTVSESSRESLREYGIRNISLVPEGLTRRPRPEVAREEVPTIIALSRLVRNKRADHAVEAFRRLRAEIPDAVLWVVGDGPELARLRRSAPAGVVFHGRVDQRTKDELLARAHVMTATAVREGWALTVDEAASMGTPTIAYDRPGLRDSVPAAGGVLVADDPAALAAGLVRHLPGWVSAPAREGWAGGAVDWDDVADAFLAACLPHVRSTRNHRDNVH
jgi:glycosyltransferase involved in cell wall biosynthesis